jgi:hypothetical protein
MSFLSSTIFVGLDFLSPKVLNIKLNQLAKEVGLVGKKLVHMSQEYGFISYI